MAPKIVDREAKRRLLLEAAATVFAARGFHDTRMIEIAEAAGVGKGTIYEYFETKEELLAGIFDLFQENFAARAAELGASDRPHRERLIEHLIEGLEAAEELAAILPVYFEFFSARFSGADAPYRNNMESFAAGLTRAYAAVIRQGQKAGTISSDLDPAAFSRMILAAVDGVALHYGFFRLTPAAFRKQKRELRRMLEAALAP